MLSSRASMCTNRPRSGTPVAGRDSSGLLRCGRSGRPRRTWSQPVTRPGIPRLGVGSSPAGDRVEQLGDHLEHVEGRPRAPRAATAGGGWPPRRTRAQRRPTVVLVGPQQSAVRAARPAAGAASGPPRVALGELPLSLALAALTNIRPVLPGQPGGEARGEAGAGDSADTTGEPSRRSTSRRTGGRQAPPLQPPGGSPVRDLAVGRPASADVIGSWRTLCTPGRRQGPPLARVVPAVGACGRMTGPPLQTTGRVRPWHSARGPPAGQDRPRDHPQLLHHRAHRPRQVDAGRPDAAADRSRRRAQCPGAVPRPDGHRARARHHDQEPGRADAVDGDRAGYEGAAPGDLRAQHDRHPGPRRLHLRGLPVPRGLRGRGPARRRGAGHRGADAGEPLPRAGRGPADHPGAEQDRPALRAAGEVRRRARRHHRLRRRPTCSRSRRRPAWASSRCSTRSSAQTPPPVGDAGASAARADLRLGLRHLPRRGHLRPGRRRQAQPPRPDQDDVDRRRARDARGRASSRRSR